MAEIASRGEEQGARPLPPSPHPHYYNNESKERGAARQRGSPTHLYWWDQEFEEEWSLKGVDEEEEEGWLSD